MCARPGQPWGGLHEQLTGKALCAGFFFNVSLDPRARPWLELLVNRTSSKATLRLTPTSFQARHGCWSNSTCISLAVLTQKEDKKKEHRVCE